MAKDYSIKVRFETETYEKVRKFAEDQGCTLSDFVRDAVEDKLAVREVLPADAEKQIEAILTSSILEKLGQSGK